MKHISSTIRTRPQSKSNSNGKNWDKIKKLENENKRLKFDI